MNIKRKNTHKVISINLKNKQSRKRNHNSYIFETNPFIFNSTPRERIMYGGLPPDTSEIVFNPNVDLPDDLNFDISAINITNIGLKNLVDKHKEVQETITLDKKYQMIVIQKKDEGYKKFEVNYQKMRKDLGSLAGGAPPFSLRKKNDFEKQTEEIKKLEKQAKKEQEKREKEEKKEREKQEKQAKKEQEKAKKDKEKAEKKERKEEIKEKKRYNHKDSMKILQDRSEELIKNNKSKEAIIKAALDFIKDQLNKEYPKSTLRTNWIPESVLDGYKTQLNDAVGKSSVTDKAKSLLESTNLNNMLSAASTASSAASTASSAISSAVSSAASSASGQTPANSLNTPEQRSNLSNLISNGMSVASNVANNIASTTGTNGITAFANQAAQQITAVANSTLKNTILPLIQQKLGITSDISEILKEDNIKELLSKGMTNIPQIVNKMIEKINEKKEQLTPENISTIASDIATSPDINLGSSIPLITGILKALPQKALENISETVKTAVSNPETEVAATGPEQSISVNAEESEDSDSVYIFDIYKIEYPLGQNFIKISFNRLDLNDKGFVYVTEINGNFKIIQGDFQNYLSELINNEQNGGHSQSGGGFKLPVSEEELERRRTKMISGKDDYQTFLVEESKKREPPDIDDFEIEAGDKQQGQEEEYENEDDEQYQEDGEERTKNKNKGNRENGDEQDQEDEENNSDNSKTNKSSNSSNSESGSSNDNNNSGDLEARVASLESLVSGIKNQLGIEPKDSNKCTNVTVPDNPQDVGQLENTDAQVKHKNMVKLSRILRLMEDNNTETLYNFIKGSDNNYEWVPTGRGTDNLCNLDLLLQRLIILSTLPLNNKEKMLFSSVLKNLDDKTDESSNGNKLSIMLDTFGLND